MELRIGMLLAFLSTLKVVRGFTLTVNSVPNDTVLFYYNNDNLGFQGRSYQFPSSKSSRLKGYLVDPGSDVCEPVPSVITNLTLFAFVDVITWQRCGGLAEKYISKAGYSAMIASTIYFNDRLYGDTDLPQVLISNTTVITALENILGPNYTYNASVLVEVWDDSTARLEQLFLIFGTMLLSAVVLAILLFCCTFICRAAIHKWRTRGLTRWQIRRLPRRKYRKSKETTETCSICLEDFKEGQAIRVLPCDHIFHPKCVDEWLQKWNRTCPLCKAAIKRSRRARNIDPDETSQLLSEDGNTSARASFYEEPPSTYGTTESTSLTNAPPPPIGSPSNQEMSEPASSSPAPSQDRDYLTPTAGSESDSLSYRTADEEATPTPAGQ